MVPWWFLISAFMLGCFTGILLIALVSANDN